MRFLLNILWFICGGFISWIEMVLVGLVCCITIVGIPWGMQAFNIAGLAAWPFGKKVEYEVGFAGAIGNIIWILLFGWETALTNLIIGFLLSITIIGIPWGNPVYPPAKAKLKEHGISCEGKYAILLKKSDYAEFDYIIGMDELNRTWMPKRLGGDPEGKISLLLDYTDHPRDVADPWYTRDFDATYRDVVEGLQGFLQYLKDEHIITL